MARLCRALCLAVRLMRVFLRNMAGFYAVMLGIDDLVDRVRTRIAR